MAQHTTNWQDGTMARDSSPIWKLRKLRKSRLPFEQKKPQNSKTSEGFQRVSDRHTGESRKIHRIGNISLLLPEPFQAPVSCVGLHMARRKLRTAWTSTGPADPPMNPRIVGAPGVGKTTLAIAVAQTEKKEVYIMQATADLRPDDLVVVPVLKNGREIEYVASPLLAAAIRGGVCVLDEGNRMSEKCWATLAPLLDQRRYLESVLAGVRIHAHPNFRFATTMNDDASAFDLPEYIMSRLSPKIQLENLNEQELLVTFKSALPHGENHWLEEIARLIRTLDTQGFHCSVRDGVQIARYADKSMRLAETHSKETPLGNPENSTQMILAEAALLTLGDEVLPYLDRFVAGQGKKTRLQSVQPERGKGDSGDNKH